MNRRKKKLSAFLSIAIFFSSQILPSWAQEAPAANAIPDHHWAHAAFQAQMQHHHAHSAEQNSAAILQNLLGRLMQLHQLMLLRLQSKP